MKSMIHAELLEQLDKATELENAIWAGDINKLHELAPCVCCCAEHTHEWCPARAWEGCRGQGSVTSKDIDEWARHYGMTRRQFLDPQQGEAA